ncbi:MAG: RNase adapter RapZ [Propionibacteriaceae bacterium]|jgi:UPF0042 nucleotide-binding protein|nr:RNase adapter RapZ [Propionibacteriaceae bacterium]
MELVIITGMSGAGRRTAAHTMEDLGWYVVDNLPPAMLPGLVSYLNSERIARVAVVLDVRSRGDLEQIPALFEAVSAVAGLPQILFIEADDAVIVKRQESSRRPVPLQGTGPLLEGIQAERRMISVLRASADMVIDTTNLTAHQLAQRIVAVYGGDHRDLMITVVSFGFKHSIPLDADMVFDVRFIPNPHWVLDLRPQTGLSIAVQAYVMGSPLTTEFLKHMDAMFATVSRGYLVEGKRMVTIAIGCTGGKHRSVAVAEEFTRRLNQSGHPASVLHRDLGRE